jgi:hypothetical protein
MKREPDDGLPFCQRGARLRQSNTDGSTWPSPTRRWAMVRSYAATANHDADDVANADPRAIVTAPYANVSVATASLGGHVNRERCRAGGDRRDGGRIGGRLGSLRRLGGHRGHLDVLRRLVSWRRRFILVHASGTRSNAARCPRAFHGLGGLALLELGDEAHRLVLVGLARQLDLAGRSLQILFEIVRQRTPVAAAGEERSRKGHQGTSQCDSHLSSDADASLCFLARGRQHSGTAIAGCGPRVRRVYTV